MADKPKDKPVGKKISIPSMKDSDAVEQIAFLLGGLLLLGSVIMAVREYLETLRLGEASGPWVQYFLQNIWPVWKFVAVIVSTAAFVGVVYNIKKLNGLDAEEHLIFNPPITPEETNPRWEKILALANSDNDSDWRLAIIEADVMLEELLRREGFVGESIGDMLKTVEKGDFLTLDDAWEAHKVRNDIAHTGTDFQLNGHETRRVIGLFEKVFKEFKII